MSTMILVRHGQASFFADDYDQLSDLGMLQAEHLGRYWADRGVAFDEVYTGPRLRQRQTAELVGAAHTRAGARWPEPVVLDDLDEFDFLGLIRLVAPDLAVQNPDFRESVALYQQSTDPAERLRYFQQAFEVLTGHWVTAADGLTGLETWPAFRTRVAGCLRRLQEQPGRGRRVGLFTSAGFIGTAVQLALAAPDLAAMELAWRVRNCALTEFIFTRDRLTLDGFNAVPHLDDPAHWTHR